MISPSGNPKILHYDIETAPMLGLTWGLWETEVVHIVRNSYFLSFAYKWEGDEEVSVLALPDFPLYKKEKHNDRALVKALHKLFMEADIVVAHNGQAFDVKTTNARFIYHDLPVPTPTKCVDTMRVAKTNFKLPSYKLDYIAKYFGYGGKIQTGGIGLWVACMKGESWAWEKMKEYNKKDVEILQWVYKRMLPWVGNHPNVNVYKGTTHNCPNCGSDKTQSRGFIVLKTGKKRRYHCKECGHWCSGETIKAKATLR